MKTPKSRTLTHIILKERESYRKMIFIAGPRQVGKTTILKQIINKLPGPLLNWDHLGDREKIIKTPYEVFDQNSNVYFDEIHKFPRWKNYLKGAFDQYGDHCQIHVTGSARLDVYRKGGDSMMGRYHLFRLHPLSVGEVLNSELVIEPISQNLILEPDQIGAAEAHEAWNSLRVLGGFPEPFYSQSQKTWQQWRNTRHEKLVREDIRDMTRIRELALLESLILLLPERASQPMSLNSLRENLEISHDSIRLWIKTLEEFYYLFLIGPYSRTIARSLKKENKLYLWDYSEIEDPGARFENQVASHLLKAIHLWNDMGLGDFDLKYIRDKEKKEVDFLLTNKRKPWLLIEAKKSDQSPSQSLIHFGKVFLQRNIPVPTLQLIDTPNDMKYRKIDGVEWTLLSASRFFKSLP